MTLELRKTLALGSDQVGVAAAETLLAWLRKHPRGTLDLAGCTHLHVATLPALMADFQASDACLRRARHGLLRAGVLALLLCGPSPAGAAPAAAARDAMATAMGEAMLRMMETMGLLGQGGAPPLPPPPAAGAWDAMTRLAPMPPPAATAGEAVGAVGALDGLWEGSDGTLLIIQGDGFRLYATLAEHLDGDLRIAGDRLILTNRGANFSQTFEYALDQDRLALRDASGQVYLYRRPRLDGGDAP